MTMTWTDANAAINDARDTIERGDMVSRNLARIMRGRLRVSDIDTETLRAFSRELKHFDARKGRWKPGTL